ncbi:MAG: DUF2497 domain-containing protein [Hyphomicrobiaceae bacterium]
MDEILASIRKIIAEEPVGSRPEPPLPPGPSRTARPGAPFGEPSLSGLASARGPSPAGAPKPASRYPEIGRAAGLNGGAHSGDGPSLPMPKSAPETAKPVDPIAAALGRSAQSPAPEAPIPSSASAEPRRQPDQPQRQSMWSQPESQAPPQSVAVEDDIGRLAEALGARPAPLPPAGHDAGADSEARGGNAGNGASSFDDELSDLLADDQPIAAAVSGPAPPSPAAEERAPSGQMIARRTIDFGSIVPQREEVREPGRNEISAAEMSAPDPEDDVPTDIRSASAAAAPAPRPTAQSRAFDRMLSHRLQTATKAAEPVPSPAPPSGPIVIAAMPDDVTEARNESEAADEQALDDAHSALGALAAGLAASQTSGATDSEPTLIVQPASNGAAIEVPSPPAPERPAPLLSSHADGEVVRDASAMFPSRAKAAAAMSAAVAKPPVPEASPAASAPATAAASAPAAVASPVAAAASIGALVAAPAALGGNVRTIEDMVAELLRPMLREWLAENMPRIVEKALRIELAEGLKTVQHPPLPRKEG